MTEEVNPEKLKQTNDFFYITNNWIPFIICTTYTNTETVNLQLSCWLIGTLLLEKFDKHIELQMIMIYTCAISGQEPQGWLQ